MRAWAVLSRGAFSGLIFLTDVALIVAMSCFTGVAYHLAAYGEPGSIPSFVQVGVLAASLFAVSNAFRDEYSLPNFFPFRPHCGARSALERDLRLPAGARLPGADHGGLFARLDSPVLHLTICVLLAFRFAMCG